MRYIIIFQFEGSNYNFVGQITLKNIAAVAKLRASSIIREHLVTEIALEDRRISFTRLDKRTHVHRIRALACLENQKTFIRTVDTAL